MRKDFGTVLGALALVLAGLAQPAPASAADAPETCAQRYMLCLNEVSQQSGGVLERTLAEASCLRVYGGCLKNQAFGL